MITIEIKPRSAEIGHCQMCKAIFNDIKYYEYHSSFSNTTLSVCYKCAIREYYGSKHTSGKKWKKDKKEGRLFGKLDSGH